MTNSTEKELLPPKTIYLLPTFEEGVKGWVWCNEPSPDEYCNPNDAVKYTRHTPSVSDDELVDLLHGAIWEEVGPEPDWDEARNYAKAALQTLKPYLADDGRGD